MQHYKHTDTYNSEDVMFASLEQISGLIRANFM